MVPVSFLHFHDGSNGITPHLAYADCLDIQAVVEGLSNWPALCRFIAVHIAAHCHGQCVIAEADKLPAEPLKGQALWPECTDLAAIIRVHLQQSTSPGLAQHQLRQQQRLQSPMTACYQSTSQSWSLEMKGLLLTCWHQDGMSEHVHALKMCCQAGVLCCQHTGIKLNACDHIHTCNPAEESNRPKLRPHCSTSCGCSFRSKMCGVLKLEVEYMLQ